LENAESYYTERVIKEADKHTRTEVLRRSIGVKSINWRNFKVYSNAKYAPYLEFGTRPHIINPVRRKALRFLYKGKIVFAKKVHHLGTKPSPFFFPENFPTRVERTKRIFLKTFLDNLTRGRKMPNMQP
jgi:hypothetical protein